MSLNRDWDVEMDEYVAAPPTFVGGTVYVGTDAGRIHAVDADSGRIEWTFETDTGHWVRAQPVYDGGLLFSGTELDWDGYVHALDAATGMEGWRYDCGDVSGVAVAGDTVYAGAGKTVLALDVMDGTEQWVYDNTDADAGYFGAPVVLDGVVCVVSEEERVYGLDAETGDGIWTLDAGGYVGSNSNHPVAGDETVYVGDDETVRALDPATGRGRWSRNVEAGGDGPVLGASSVYVAGGQTVTAIDRASGDIEWETTLGGELTRPGVGSHGVYVGTESGTLYELDPDDGGRTDSLDLAGDALTKPTVGETTLFVGSFDWTLYAVDLGEPPSSPPTGREAPSGFRQRAAERSEDSSGDSSASEGPTTPERDDAGCPNCGERTVPEERTLRADDRSCRVWVCPRCETILDVIG
ncbi:MAG: PQQ-binding-like beta-propeller repeat protein [Haloquadratum sp.]